MKIPSSLIIFGLFVVALGILPLLCPLGLPVHIIALLTFIFLFATLSQSWNYIGGYAGYVHFGGNMFFGIGAYVAALLILHYGWSVFGTMFLGGGLAAGFALVVGKPTLRLRGPYFSIATLALSVTVTQFILAERWLTWGGRGIPNIWDPLISEANHRNAFYWIFLGLMTASTLVAWKIENSRFGYGLMAIRENEDAAPVLGVDTTKLKLQAFILSAFFGSVAGSFYAPYLTWINPDTTLAVSITLFPILMAILGGTGTVFGPIIGAFMLESLKRYIIFYAIPGSSAHLMIYGPLLVVLVLIMPQGILGFIRGRRLAGHGALR